MASLYPNSPGWMKMTSRRHCSELTRLAMSLFLVRISFIRRGLFFFFFFFFSRAHCARDSAHVVANPIQPDPFNTSSINQTGNLAVYSL